MINPTPDDIGRPTGTLEILKAARELIAVPERWTQGDFARNFNGDGVMASDKDACSWCARGAIIKVSGHVYSHAAAAAKDALAKLVPGRRVADFNDTHDHSEVLAVFDKAIASLSAEVSP